MTWACVASRRAYGDTDSAERARQSKQLPEVLITTPESLSLMLTRSESREQLSDLAMIVVDEWHELIGTKRGVQVQLALSRLRMFARERAAQSAAVPRPGRGTGVAGLSVGAFAPPASAACGVGPVGDLGQHRARDARAAQSRRRRARTRADRQDADRRYAVAGGAQGVSRGAVISVSPWCRRL